MLSVCVLYTLVNIVNQCCVTMLMNVYVMHTLTLVNIAVQCLHNFPQCWWDVDRTFHQHHLFAGQAIFRVKNLKIGSSERVSSGFCMFKH